MGRSLWALDGERFSREGLFTDEVGLIGDLPWSAYHQQVSDWCEDHHLQYMTEVPSVRMTTQRYSHIPGGDSAHEKVGRPLEWILERYAYSLRGDPKIASSLACQLGRFSKTPTGFTSGTSPITPVGLGMP
jgi:hypothetical protein